MFEIVIICAIFIITIKYNLFYSMSKMSQCVENAESRALLPCCCCYCWLDVVGLRWLSWAFRVQFSNSTVCEM